MFMNIWKGDFYNINEPLNCRTTSMTEKNTEPLILKIASKWRRRLKRFLWWISRLGILPGYKKCEFPDWLLQYIETNNVLTQWNVNFPATLTLGTLYHLHGKTRNSRRKIKWFTPFNLGNFRKYGLWFEVMQYFLLSLVCLTGLDTFYGGFPRHVKFCSSIVTNKISNWVACVNNGKYTPNFPFPFLLQLISESHNLNAAVTRC